MKTKKEVRKALTYRNLCTALVDARFDEEPNHVPNPIWKMDGDSACVECGGFIPNSQEEK